MPEKRFLLISHVNYLFYNPIILAKGKAAALITVNPQRMRWQGMYPTIPNMREHPGHLSARRDQAMRLATVIGDLAVQAADSHTKHLADVQSDLGVFSHDFLKLLLLQGKKAGGRFHPDGSRPSIIAE